MEISPAGLLGKILTYVYQFMLILILNPITS